MKFTSQSFSSTVSSTDKSLKDESCLLLLWDGSLVTLNTLCSYNTMCGEASAHLYGEEQSFIKPFKKTQSWRMEISRSSSQLK